MKNPCKFRYRTFQLRYVLLEWVGLHAMGGIQNNTLRGGAGFEENLLRQLSLLRGEYFNIGDYQAGRMPLAYVQLVQVLVDSLVALAPLALSRRAGKGGPSGAACARKGRLGACSARRNWYRPLGAS